MRKVFFTIGLLIGLFNSNSSDASSLTTAGVIDKMGAMAFPNFEVWGTFSDPENCGSSTKVVVGLHSTDPDISRNSKYTMAMTALVSGKKVQFVVDGCVGSYPVVKGMQLLK